MKKHIMHNGTEATLKTLATTRLFDDDVPWPADRETAAALGRILQEMGLEERVSENTFRRTSLGRALNIDLQTVFMGYWDITDMFFVLEEYSLIDEEEVEEILSLLEQGQYSEQMLRARVRQAYREHYGAALH
jgi:hypothetical protein